MTTKELIAKLQALDPDGQTEVVLGNDQESCSNPGWINICLEHLSWKQCKLHRHIKCQRTRRILIH